MRRLPTITNSNLPKEPTALDRANACAARELSGIVEAAQLVQQVHKYDGGQMDLFPNELFKVSPLFRSNLAED